MFKERFSSRLGFILSMMGIAVGAGNIWRFPRVVAQNGNGAFLLAWVLFLFTWSIPLIIVELSIGKLTKSPPIQAIAAMAGKKFAWMGAFITLVTTGILAYYSIVVSWGVNYSVYAVQGKLLSHPNLTVLWSETASGYQTLLIHGLVLLCALFVINKGVSGGIELCNKVLIPGFFICISLIFIQALCLPEALAGIKKLFTLDIQSFKESKTWIEALTQNAWDTGAGWGLLLVYAGFAPKKEGVVTNGSLTAISNNLVSLIMGMILFAVITSLDFNGISALREGEGSTSLGLTFVYLPRLFLGISPYTFLQYFSACLFFLAFTMAAFSSMISMLFLLAQTLKKIGLAKKETLANFLACLIAFVLGVPSALNLSFFQNQDTVWSIALIINGLFIIFAALKFGVWLLTKEINKFSEKDFKLRKGFVLIIRFAIPIQGIILLAWFLKMETMNFNIHHFFTTNVGNMLLQWGIPLVIFISLNKRLIKNTY